MLLKQRRNCAVSFGMLRERQLLLLCWFVTAMVLVHQTFAEDVATEEVGFGRHKKAGTTVTLGKSSSWKVAESETDLTEYKKAAAMNSCPHVDLNDKKDIIVRYKKSGTPRNVGCLVDLLTQSGSKTSVKFHIGIHNGNGLGNCLWGPDPKSDCWWCWTGRCCNHYSEKVYASRANMMPFIYGRTVEDFQKMRNRVFDLSSSCSSCSGGIRQCAKWTGLGAGFMQDGSVVRTMVGIGDPGGSYCYTGTPPGNNDAEIEISVDSGNLKWFKTKGCDKDEDSNFPYHTTCVDKTEMSASMKDVVSWEITDKSSIGGHIDGLDHLFSFALLPQGSLRAHHGNDPERGNRGLREEKVSGPSCDEIFVRFPNETFKLLVPTSDVVGSTLPPVVTEPQTGEITTTTVIVETEGGMGYIFVIIIVVVVLILAVVGVLIYLFVLRKSEPDAVEEDYFGTTKAGTTAKTKAGTTVGATQAKTGGMTTTKAGTTAKTAAAGTKAGTTAAGTKAGTTAGGKTAGGGGTTKTKK